MVQHTCKQPRHWPCSREQPHAALHRVGLVEAEIPADVINHLRSVSTLWHSRRICAPTSARWTTSVDATAWQRGDLRHQLADGLRTNRPAARSSHGSPEGWPSASSPLGTVRRVGGSIGHRRTCRLAGGRFLELGTPLRKVRVRDRERLPSPDAKALLNTSALGHRLNRQIDDCHAGANRGSQRTQGASFIPPGAGKTTGAPELETAHRALRFSPDEWMIPLFGESEADGKRDLLEELLIHAGLCALAVGTNVVLDFGFWGCSPTIKNNVAGGVMTQFSSPPSHDPHQTASDD